MLLNGPGPGVEKALPRPRRLRPDRLHIGCRCRSGAGDRSAGPHYDWSSTPSSYHRQNPPTTATSQRSDTAGRSRSGTCLRNAGWLSTLLWLAAEIPTGNSPNADQFCHPTLPIRLSWGVTSYSALAITCCGSSIGMLIFVPPILWRIRSRQRTETREVRPKAELDNPAATDR